MNSKAGTQVALRATGYLTTEPDYPAATIFSGLSMTSGYLLYQNEQFENKASVVGKAPNRST